MLIEAVHSKKQWLTRDSCVVTDVMICKHSYWMLCCIY